MREDFLLEQLLIDTFQVISMRIGSLEITTFYSQVFEKLHEGISIQPLFWAEDYLISILSYKEIALYREFLNADEYSKISKLKEDDNICLAKLYFNE